VLRSLDVDLDDPWGHVQPGEEAIERNEIHCSGCWRGAALLIEGMAPYLPEGVTAVIIRVDVKLGHSGFLAYRGVYRRDVAEPVQLDVLEEVVVVPQLGLEGDDRPLRAHERSGQHREVAHVRADVDEGIAGLE